MAAPFPAGIVIAAVLFPAFVVVCSFPTTLPLERVIPPSHKLELSYLKERDSIRHGRMLQAIDGVVSFPALGTFNPYLVGLYYTRVQLGSPPKNFYVQIDTGSDVLWVSCSSCDGCPTTSGLDIPLSFFDPGSSRTASSISCQDKRCRLGSQSTDSVCASGKRCSYTFQYGDGSGTSGYYVSDMLRMDVYAEALNSTSAPIVFGCSTQHTGDLTKPDRAVDGIFGFGRAGMSVISQLSSQGITPNVFSHCLKGDDAGGGVLVMGEVLEPNIVYTPLVPSQSHYNIHLQSIAVAGETLPINPSVFVTTSTQGTIIDSGTTLAYLAEAAYDPFIYAVTTAVAKYVRTFLMLENQCYSISPSIDVAFPLVTFNFAGGASMVLTPREYLVPRSPIDGNPVWCIGFQKVPDQQITILGDLVLKDKIIIYDIANQRIGWTPFDCSAPVNVSTTIIHQKSAIGSEKSSSDAGLLTNTQYKLIQMTTQSAEQNVQFSWVRDSELVRVFDCWLFVARSLF
ncbi:hypothetical protein JCGZ_05398 [Jatropha curcas]|uniref:Peptidase A1 domain-containing protein n=1 Tax=Jatropha curcas TaxID=180498 RepID=A0A067L636_JATCU|nr:aspartic proteinase 39 [Jatropha curcas]KDP43931.1 hypothetical protein JCGZ_05398 [Jatropha curcas]